MKCVICKSADIKKRKVQEEIKRGDDIVLAPFDILVCSNCGERYYDRDAMRKIENIKERLVKHELKIKEIGRVFLAEAV